MTFRDIPAHEVVPFLTFLTVNGQTLQGERTPTIMACSFADADYRSWKTHDRRDFLYEGQAGWPQEISDVDFAKDDLELQELIKSNRDMAVRHKIIEGMPYKIIGRVSKQELDAAIIEGKGCSERKKREQKKT